jgi:hypothetical protein
MDHGCILGTLFDKLGVSHVIENCLCAMFGFQPGTLHISKDDAFDDNNNVTRFVCQVPFSSGHELEIADVRMSTSCQISTVVYKVIVYHVSPRKVKLCT